MIMSCFGGTMDTLPARGTLSEEEPAAADVGRPPAEGWLASIVDWSHDAIVSKDLNSTITTWNKAAERLFGYTAEEAVGSSVMMLIPDHLRGEEEDIIARIKAGTAVQTYETVRRRKDGTLVEVSLTISPIRAANGRIIGASKIARDISSARESEKRIRVLMAEVSHRVKNQFAVILSMIRETGRWTPDPAVFQQRVRERIMALARSHDLLVATDWAGTDLNALITAQLEFFENRERVILSGPLIALSPMAIQYLGIAFHELAANSDTYGALGRLAGRIHISWEIVTEPNGERHLSLWWRERFDDVAVLSEQVREGFGTMVLRRITPQALSGRAQLDRSPRGLTWFLSAPLGAIRPQ